MRRSLILSFLGRLGWVSLFLFPGIASAAQLKTSVQASGGPQVGATQRLWSVAGEPAVGRLASSSYTLELGFLASAFSGSFDPTPPTTPVVTDDGDWTTSTSTLHAIWTSSDPESGIAEYQYAIGTTAGGTDVVNWTSTGTTAYVNRTGLSLVNGKTYYFAVKAKNGAGSWSDVGVSDGILVNTAAPTALITSPTEGQILLVDDPLPFIGSASGANFQSYTLEYGAGLSPNAFTLLTASFTPVTNSILYALDFHLLRFLDLEFPPGSYTFRLTVQDTSGKVTRFYRSIAFDYLYINNVSVNPFFIDPYKGENAGIQFTLNRAADVTLRIYNFPLEQLVQTLAQPGRPAGANVISWDGKDPAGNIAPLAVYYFTIQSTDAFGRKGTYNRATPPLPGPLPSILNAAVNATNFNPYRNDLVQISYDFTDLGWATIWVSDPDGFIVSIIDNLAVRTPGSHVESWDGRRIDGSLYQGAFDVSFGTPERLPLNPIVLNRPSIDFTDFRAQAYLVQPLFGEVSTLTYTLTQDANVSITITDPNGNVIRTLLSNVAQKAGPQSIEWDGRTDTGNLVSVEGDYTVTLTAVDTVSGVSTERLGSILMYK